MSSSGIISSTVNSAAECSISDLLLSPYLSLISDSSSLIISILLPLSERISFKFFICLFSSSFSLLIFSLSRPVSFWSLISNIALDCISDNLYFDINPFLASSGLFDFLINSITSSMLSRAIIYP